MKREIGSISDVANGVTLSLTSLGSEFGMDRETVQKKLINASVMPIGKRGGYPIYRLRDVWRVLAGGVDELGRLDPDRLPQFQRKAYWDAEMKKLNVQVALGNLCPRIEVEGELSRCFKLFAQFLNTLPDVLERDFALPTKALEAIELRIDDLREDLHRQMCGEDSSMKATEPPEDADRVPPDA